MTEKPETKRAKLQKKYSKYREAALIVLGITAVGGVRHYLESDGTNIEGYSFRDVYHITRACVDGAGVRTSASLYAKKEDICLCAVEETVNSVSYERYQSNSAEFFSILRKEAKSCS